jgi:DegV family protein with EDD domain
MGRPCFSGPFSNAVDGGLLFGYNGKNFAICVNKLEDEPLADYILSCCSTADLSKEHFEARHIVYLCAHYRLDGVEYRDDLGQTLPFDKFYEALKAGKESSTYQLNVSEYAEHFEKFLKQGRDVVHVCLSSGITSGTIGAARTAAEMLAPEYPDRKVYVVDSLGASSGYGLLMDKLADKRDEGLAAAELADWAEKNRLRVNHWFFSTDLTFYVKGGRISKAAGIFGGALNICPIMNMDNLGRLIPRIKARGRKNAMRECLSRMKELAEGGADYSGKCYISNSNCPADARALADLVEENFPKLAGAVEINSIGTTVGSHTGPGTVALFFWGAERTE